MSISTQWCVTVYACIRGMGTLQKVLLARNMQSVMLVSTIWGDVIWALLWQYPCDILITKKICHICSICSDDYVECESFFRTPSTNFTKILLTQVLKRYEIPDTDLVAERFLWVKSSAREKKTNSSIAHTPSYTTAAVTTVMQEWFVPSLNVIRLKCDWQTGRVLWRDGWRFASTDIGPPFVTICGATMMLRWPVDSWNFLGKV